MKIISKLRLMTFLAFGMVSLTSCLTLAAPLIRERTALSLDAVSPQTQETPVESFRAESFGNTRLHVRLVGAEKSYLRIEGPLAVDGKENLPCQGPLVGEAQGVVEVSPVLALPGAYRFIVGSQPVCERVATEAALSLPLTNPIIIQSECLEKCGRDEITNKVFLQNLKSKQEFDPVISFLEKEIDQFILRKPIEPADWDKFQKDHDVKSFMKSESKTFNGYMASELLSKMLHAQLNFLRETILGTVDNRFSRFVYKLQFAEATHFPTIPMSLVGWVRPVAAEYHVKTAKKEDVVQGELKNLLAAARPDRSVPRAISKQMPDVQFGQFPDLTLTDSQNAQGHALAGILTALANNPVSGFPLSWVKYRNQTYTTPATLLRALIDSGHTVTLKNERMYANFLSIASGGRDVRWPVWLDTGVRLDNGQKLVIPMGHSQHAWEISGPEVNTKVSFYLGVTGAAFFPVDRRRPDWTGTRALYTYSTAQNETETIIKALDVATVYLRRIKSENETVAKGLPADGYGFLGVCNDSTAVVEKAIRGQVSEFPLARASKLDTQAPRLNDGLDDLLRQLPHDIDHTPRREEVMRRVYSMMPYHATSLPPEDPHALSRALEKASWDPELESEMKEVGQSLGFRL